MMASFEAIFATAEAHGLHLNNLYQMEDGKFRCNFRSDAFGHGLWFSPMSENADPRAALEAALEIALARLAKFPLRPAATVVHEHREEAEERGLFD
jgi:hypothetical protein